MGQLLVHQVPETMRRFSHSQALGTPGHDGLTVDPVVGDPGPQANFQVGRMSPSISFSAVRTYLDLWPVSASSEEAPGFAE